MTLVVEIFNPCACGCYGLTPALNKNGKPARYKPFHHLREHNKTYPFRRKGEDNPSWRGGKRLLKGYVLVYSPDHPYRDSGNYVLEHRLVMERHIGRYLKPGEVVHHRNGIPTDNRIENLELLSSAAEHRRLHIKISQSLIKN